MKAATIDKVIIWGGIAAAIALAACAWNAGQLRSGREDCEAGAVVLPEGGSRTGMFFFDTRYIVDNGSYLTNDVCHVALTKTVSLIPDTTQVLCFYRELGQTNAEDWVQFVPVLSIADFPHDYYLENATNYDVTVSADYVPPTPEVTNLLFRTSAKICMGWLDASSLPLVVPGTHLEDVKDGKTKVGGTLYKAVKKQDETSEDE